MSLQHVAVLSSKGGVGKSTLSMAIAQATGRTLLDADAQQTSRHWHRNRPEGSSPLVISDHLANVPFLIRDYPGLVVDTPGSSLDKVGETLKVVDLILVVTSDRWADLDAVGTSLAAASQTGKPVAVVLNRMHPSTDAGPALELLNTLGIPVCPVVMRERAAHYQAQMAGMTALEVEPEGKAAQEVLALVQWMEGLVP